MHSPPLLLSLSLLLSLPLLFLFPSHFLPSSPSPLPDPISPSDELDDLSLFRRASTSSISHLSTTTSPNLKLAFLFLTNTDLHFAPLWQKFFDQHGGGGGSFYNVYVHADPSVNITRPSGVFLNRFVPSKQTSRASPTLISATRRLLAHALIDDPANAYFAVLSQYCIPLHSFDYIYSSLFTSPTFDSTESTRYGVRVRYRSYIEVLDESPSLWKRYTSRGRYAMLPEVPYSKFRVGSQFFILTRRHARVAVRDRSMWRKFRLPCYREDTCYPEEHYFPTLLSMKDPSGCTRYTLTRVNWTGTVNGHPHTYGHEEVNAELIRRLRVSSHSESYLFARKFSPDCLEPLMEIADDVVFRD